MKIKLTSLYVDDQEKALRFYTDDVQGDCERVTANGGNVTMPPTEATGSTIAQLNDTCGNIIQITQSAHW